MTELLKENVVSVIKSFHEKVKDDYVFTRELDDKMIEKVYKALKKGLKKRKVEPVNKERAKINTHLNKRAIKAVKLNDNTEQEFKSIYACSKALNINSGLIKQCCEKLNYVKSGSSKTDGKRYAFSYA